MTNDDVKALCLALMQADTEDQVIALLTKAGFWDVAAAWRYYGDYENNFNTIGNQQSRPDAALVEKLVNSEDARLMNECLAKGINPEGPTAPSSVRDAVALFFESKTNQTNSILGRISNWSDQKRTEVA